MNLNDFLMKHGTYYNIRYKKIMITLKLAEWIFPATLLITAFLACLSSSILILLSSSLFSTSPSSVLSIVLCSLSTLLSLSPSTQSSLVLPLSSSTVSCGELFTRLVVVLIVSLISCLSSSLSILLLSFLFGTPLPYVHHQHYYHFLLQYY